MSSLRRRHTLPNRHFTYQSLENTPPSRKSADKEMKPATLIAVLFALLAVTAIIVLAVLTAIFHQRSLGATQNKYVYDEKVHDALYANVVGKNIREHLYHFTEELGWKLAGTKAEKDAALYIKDQFVKNGLAGVQLLPYQVLLSYPDETHNNVLKVTQGGNVVYETKAYEDMSLPHVRNQSQYSYYLRKMFNAYTASGDVTGTIRFLDHGTEEDFEKVKGKLNKNVICLARYGKGSRMLKAELATKYGCGGVVLYSDPRQFNVAGNDKFYPDSEYLPETGVQRGTLKNQDTGDYLTPSYPAVKEAYRIKQSDSSLPTIPFQVIRQDDAEEIFKRMGCSQLGVCGEDDTAQGTLSVKVQTVVNETNNIIGYIKGKEEPDRYVVVGNHYDSWGPGSIDPNIGSSIVIELSRVLMDYHKKTGWRPRRSIIFIEWGAEEYGSLGSREFIEQFSKQISAKTVGYINTDVAVLGRYSIKFKSQPLLRKIIYETAKKIPEPEQKDPAKTKFLYETYKEKLPLKGTDLPKIYPANTGSDYVNFIGIAGVPSIDVRYTYDESLGLDFYPLYHSGYENFHLFEKYIDPEFKYSEVVAKVMGELALRLASEAVLPYSIDDYVSNIEECYTEAQKRLKDEKAGLTDSQIAASSFDAKLDKLKSARDSFKKRMEEVDKDNVLELRIINDQLMLLEKAFLYQHTLEGKETVRNALHAPYDKGQKCLAILHTHLDDYKKADAAKKAEVTEEVRKEVSRIHHFLDTAISVLDSKVLP